MLKSSDQLDFLDLLSVLSFLIAIENLKENVSQSDIQDVMKELANKADVLLTEIHGHLEDQDIRLDNILKELEKIKNEKSRENDLSYQG